MENEFNIFTNEFLTPEYFKKLAQKRYVEDREYPENFSNWYSHIIDFGKFKNANVISNQIFNFDETQIMRQVDDITKVDLSQINKILQPTLDKMKSHRIYNIKNGCFSNKFDFKTCITTKENLAKNLSEINNVSAMFDTGGYTELVVRELIPYNYENTPTIYNGMPLREEIRAFYNMDKKCIEYLVDYWDYDYCNKYISDKTDNIIFNWFHNKMPGREICHKKQLEKLENIISDNINTLKFDDVLTGIWSIDFMYNETDNNLYLIDMARGFRSAYWKEIKEEYKNG